MNYFYWCSLILLWGSFSVSGDTVGGRKVKFFSDKATYREAFKSCHMIGMHLLIAEDEYQMFEALEVAKKENRSEFWLGALNFDNKPFHWSESGKDVSWFPNPVPIDEIRCLAQEGSSMKWVASPCSAQRPFICQESQCSQQLRDLNTTVVEQEDQLRDFNETLSEVNNELDKERNTTDELQKEIVEIEKDLLESENQVKNVTEELRSEREKNDKLVIEKTFLNDTVNVLRGQLEAATDGIDALTKDYEKLQMQNELLNQLQSDLNQSNVELAQRLKVADQTIVDMKEKYEKEITELKFAWEWCKVGYEQLSANTTDLTMKLNEAQKQIDILDEMLTKFPNNVQDLRRDLATRINEFRNEKNLRKQAEKHNSVQAMKIRELEAQSDKQKEEIQQLKNDLKNCEGRTSEKVH